MADKDEPLIAFNHFVNQIVEENDGVPAFNTEVARVIYDRFKTLPYETKLLLVYRALGCQSREDKHGNTVCPVYIRHQKKSFKEQSDSDNTDTNKPRKLLSDEENELLKTRFWIFKMVFSMLATGGLLFLGMFFYFFIKLSTENTNILDALFKIFKIVMQ